MATDGLAAGITRVIAMLPDSMSSDRTRLIEIVRNLIAGCIPYLREDGRFHDTLDDPGSFIDTNSAQEIAYTIYRGTAAGWLDED